MHVNPVLGVLLLSSPGHYNATTMADEGYYHHDAEEARVTDEVHDYLLQLDALRVESERKGDFLRAHECINRMREVNLRFAKRLQVKSHQANSDAKVVLAEKHKAELLTFTRMWEDKLRDYDGQAARIVEEIKLKHTQDYRGQEGILKVQLMNKRPRFSRAVIELRSQMERCVQQRNYLEAEELKKKLVVLEQHEVESFDDSLAVTFEKRTRTLKTQYVNELKAVEQKIAVGREELLTARKIEFEKLVRRHANVFRELDQDTKNHISRTRTYIKRQVKAMVQDPVKTGMELRGVAATLRSGGTAARKFLGGTAAAPGVRPSHASPSAQRARTPTTGGRTAASFLDASGAAATPRGAAGSPSRVHRRDRKSVV